MLCASSVSGRSVNGDKTTDLSILVDKWQVMPESSTRLSRQMASLRCSSSRAESALAGSPEARQGHCEPCGTPSLHPWSVTWPCCPSQWLGRVFGAERARCVRQKARGPPEKQRPPHRVFRGLACSLRYLYFNSSSSRAGHFLWINRFCPMLTGTCVPPNGVGGRVFLLYVEMNNLARPTISVDNYRFVPAGCTGLSTRIGSG